MLSDGDSARTIAESALHFVLADPELVETLLGVTGATPAGLRQMAADGGLALACLDVVMASDDRVLAFAEAAGLRPEAVARAHAILGGPVSD